MWNCVLLLFQAHMEVMVAKSSAHVKQGSCSETRSKDGMTPVAYNRKLYSPWRTRRVNNYRHSKKQKILEENDTERKPSLFPGTPMWEKPMWSSQISELEEVWSCHTTNSCPCMHNKNLLAKSKETSVIGDDHTEHKQFNIHIPRIKNLTQNIWPEIENNFLKIKDPSIQKT